jgi:amino acid transporter
MVVIGGIIGSGIFINPYLVARALDTPALVLAAWAAGGAIALAGAFAYAELGQRMPQAGGQYVYLSKAWHPVVGFLYGWALVFMIETGAMAAVAISFAQYALRLAGQPDTAVTIVAIAAIVLLSAINYVGVTPGSRVLNVFVLLKVGALALIILLALWGPSAPEWLSAARVDDTPSGALAFGAALIPILFAYGGWQNANYVAEEMRDPKRHLPRALIIGTSIVVLVYLLANVAYLRTLGLAGLAGTETPAADAAARWLGSGGARFVAAAIAISTFGFLDLAILAPTRVSTRWQRRRILSVARETASALSDTIRSDRAAVVLGHRAGAHRQIRRSAQHRGVCRLDLLWADGRRSVHAASIDGDARWIPHTRLSVVARRVRARLARGRLQRGARSAAPGGGGCRAAGRRHTDLLRVQEVHGAGRRRA